MRRILLICLFILTFAKSAGQVKVTFNINNLPAKPTPPKAVYLAGSFNGWNPSDSQWRIEADGSSKYIATFNMKAASYEYKVTRGSWTTVECNLQGSSAENRILVITHDTTINLSIIEWQDNFPNVTKKHTASHNVHVVNERFAMPQLRRERKIWIYLPEGYGKSRKRYPVIYMHDGQNLFDKATANSGEWAIDEFLDQLETGKQQAIVVGIDHGGQYRLTEYNPYDSQFGKGNGIVYTQFLVQTLKPYIDAHYRTRRNAKSTTIAGSSMGGLISMYAALSYPEVFGNAGIFSPSFWIAPQVYDYAKAKASKTSRFYFVCGSSESAGETAEMNKMVAILKGRGLPEKNIPSTIINGGRHEEKQWRQDFPDFYKWLMMGK